MRKRGSGLRAEVGTLKLERRQGRRVDLLLALLHRMRAGKGPCEPLLLGPDVVLDALAVGLPRGLDRLS